MLNCILKFLFNNPIKTIGFIIYFWSVTFILRYYCIKHLHLDTNSIIDWIYLGFVVWVPLSIILYISIYLYIKYIKKLNPNLDNPNLDFSFNSFLKSINFSNALFLLIILISSFLLRDIFYLLLILSFATLSKLFLYLSSFLTYFLNNCPKHILNAIYLSNPKLAGLATVISAGDLISINAIIFSNNKVNILKGAYNNNSIGNTDTYLLFSPSEAEDKKYRQSIHDSESEQKKKSRCKKKEKISFSFNKFWLRDKTRQK